jgi:hypothetical protein
MYNGQWLPTRKQIVHIAKILEHQVQQSLCENCQQADYGNLAVDGWTDPRGGRYQAVTVRFLKGIVAAPVGLLAMKEVKSVYERAAELRAMIQHLPMPFRIADKTLHLCSDRCNMNVRPSGSRREFPIQAIPSISTVRWYRSEDILRSLLILWLYMEEFTQEE